MGHEADKKLWIDKYWMFLLIAFGVSCVLGIIFFQPHF
ncbi:hypothetical protein SAMN05421819_3007 [Bryocella elongata]|uniref:Uncharacterized protein n=1 Tax=Bryocella elongata TaxID=863522 RepID=A0A1H6AB36_9BACT|nr:hypothetical protein SAMN05421819_3007 [Bryocella elongata]